MAKTRIYPEKIPLISGVLKRDGIPFRIEKGDNGELILDAQTSNRRLREELRDMDSQRISMERSGGKLPVLTRADYLNKGKRNRLAGIYKTRKFIPHPKDKEFFDRLGR